MEATEQEKEKIARFRVRVSKGDVSVILRVPKDGPLTQLAGNREQGGAEEASALLEEVRKAIAAMPVDERVEPRGTERAGFAA